MKYLERNMKLWKWIKLIYGKNNNKRQKKNW